jgi:hypothetical protein
MSEFISLKDFIKATLDDICCAVEEVRKDKPYVARCTKSMRTEAGFDMKDATQIDFDISVSVTDNNKQADNNSQNIGVSVLKIGAGIDKKKEKSSENSISSVNRIKFSVPIFFVGNQEQQ